MSAPEVIMAESKLTLSDQERQYLVALLTQTLKEKRIEEHRTDALSYKEIVLREEGVIQGLLTKLGQAAPV